MRAAKWIMRAITLVVTAIVLCVIVSAAVLGRQARISIKKEKSKNVKSAYTEYVQTLGEAFQDMQISAAPDMDIAFVPSEDGVSQVSYYNSDDVIHQIQVVDGTLEITCVDNRMFGSDLGFGDDPYITISLPKARYGNVSIVSETGNISLGAQFGCSRLDVQQKKGDIFLSGVTGNDISIQTASGDVTVATVKADRMKVSGKSGDFTIMNVDVGEGVFSSGDGALSGYNIISGGSAFFETDSGDMSVEESDGPYLRFDSQKGDINITLLTEKRFKAESVNGEINIPVSSIVSKEQCSAMTESGSIDIKYVNE